MNRIATALLAAVVGAAPILATATAASADNRPVYRGKRVHTQQYNNNPNWAGVGAGFVAGAAVGVGAGLLINRPPPPVYYAPPPPPPVVYYPAPAPVYYPPPYAVYPVPYPYAYPVYAPPYYYRYPVYGPKYYRGRPGYYYGKAPRYYRGAPRYYSNNRVPDYYRGVGAMGYRPGDRYANRGYGSNVRHTRGNGRR